MSGCLTEDPRGVRLAVRVMPRSQPTGPAGERDGRLVVRLGAAPVDGEANRALLKALSDLFGVARGAVTILAGETSRNKSVLVSGLSLANAQRCLEAVA